MELSILAIVTGEPPIHQFPYRPWESISPREDVESASLYASFSHLLTDTLLRGIQGLCRTSRALPEWWQGHQTSGLAEVNFGTITVPFGFEACVSMPQVIPLTHRQCDT